MNKEKKLKDELRIRISPQMKRTLKDLADKTGLKLSDFTRLLLAEQIGDIIEGKKRILTGRIVKFS